jgi:hypothetical protein
MERAAGAGPGAGTELRQHLERAYAASIRELQGAPAYARLAAGQGARAEYDALLLKVCETHLLSAHFVAFAFSLAPPRAAASFQHNLLEELGADGGEAHPSLLIRLLVAAGLGGEEAAVRSAGRLRLEEKVLEPLFYGSLREVGLAALVEIVGFELMLSRLASEMAGFLERYRGLSRDALAWFTHHSEVDVAHAEQGLDAIAEYVDHYRFERTDALAIVDTALERNIYVLRYFGPQALALP